MKKTIKNLISKFDYVFSLMMGQLLLTLGVIMVCAQCALNSPLGAVLGCLFAIAGAACSCTAVKEIKDHTSF